MNYTYLVGGILIGSDIQFKELKMSPGIPVAYISYGDVPENLETNFVNFPFLQINLNQYLLKIPGIGSYLVENGNKITIAPEDNAQIGDVNKQVLTSAFSALSYQRGFIPFHGGLVIINEFSYLISGLSGSGKSTLLAMLTQRGHTVIADDISNVQLIDGQVLAYPTFPRIMLWQNAAEYLNINLSEDDKLRHDIQKYLIPIDDTAFSHPVPLKKVVILQTNMETGEIVSIRGMDKIEKFKENLFHPYLVDALGLQKIYAKKLLEIAGSIELILFGNEKVKGITALADAFENMLKDVK